MSFLNRRKSEERLTPLAPPTPPPAFEDSRSTTPPPPFPTRNPRLISTASTTRVDDPTQPAPDARLPVGSFANEASMVTFIRTKRLTKPPKTAAKKKLDDVMSVLYGHEYMYDQGRGRRAEDGVGGEKLKGEQKEKMSWWRRWMDGYYVDEDFEIPSRWPELEDKEKNEWERKQKSEMDSKQRDGKK
ncbi:hypothetical protein HDU96_010715 [Phlyctochytrium bullatum]|nr:hypothetical protein HDU96_010715 [Phlyctochytrium bullatum]